MTKQKNISYIPYLAKKNIEETIANLNAKLESVRTLLLENNEGIKEAIEYQQKGVDWKRKATIDECKAYIERTQMPEYLQGQALQAAYDSCDNKYISQLAGVFGSLRINLANDIEVLSDKWLIAQHIIEKVIEDNTYTLTDKEMTLFAKYKQMITLAEELHREYYYFGSTIDYNDELKMQPTEAELAERFIGCQRATPEQLAERQRKYGRM